MPKSCNVCKEQKPEAMFSRRAASVDGLCHTCKACSAARNRAWREENPEGFKDWAEKNTDRRRESWLKWSSENRGRISQTYAQWVERNRAHVYARNAARVAAKFRATPAWADMDQIKAVYERAVQMTRETGVRHEVDHYYPLRGGLVSGLHCHQNLQILTRSENARKKNHMPMESQ